MYTLSWLLSISLAVLIGRVFKSWKLCASLLMAILIGFAATTIYVNTHNSSNDDKVGLMQVYPTQAQVVTSGCVVYPVTDVISLVNDVKVKLSAPVSQDYTPATDEVNLIASKVYGRTRDQPILVKPKPPELCLHKIFTTHHDSG